MEDEEREPDHIIAIIPGGNWFVNGVEVGEETKSPIVAWGLQLNGIVVPLVVDGEGYVGPWKGESGFIDHPDAI